MNVVVVRQINTENKWSLLNRFIFFLIQKFITGKSRKRKNIFEIKTHL